MIKKTISKSLKGLVRTIRKELEYATNTTEHDSPGLKNDFYKKVKDLPSEVLERYLARISPKTNEEKIAYFLSSEVDFKNYLVKKELGQRDGSYNPVSLKNNFF